MNLARADNPDRTAAPACWLLATSAVLALVMALGARMLGPSDLWNQTQPRTVSYTTDMIVHGRWILPIERGEFPATKPPLYNWLAAPAVALVGFASEWAHKSPSVVALVVVWAATIRLAGRIGGGTVETSKRRNVETGDLSFPRLGPSAVGWMAGLAIPTNYMLFKLGYLARPDMVLTLWLLLGWMAGTAAVLRERSRGWLQLAFWVCAGLAGLTKGPAALVLVVYGLVAGKALTGAWRNTARLGWLWGLPVALAMVGAWLVAVWRIDPGHLVNELWYAEIAGRVTGTGPKGAEGSGPWYFVTSLPHMSYYFLSRVAPWSVVAILAMVHLWRRNLSPPNRNWQVITEGDGRWYHACTVLIVVTVALFTLSTGKRADYVAVTAPPTAILAGYWLLRVRADVAKWSRVLAPVAAAITLGAMIYVESLQPFAPSRTYGGEIRSFIEHAEETISERPLPIVFYHAGASHVQAFLGESEIDGLASLENQLASGAANASGGASGGAFWLISGPLPVEAPRVEQVVATAGREYTLTPEVVSDPAVPGAQWPGRTTLWLVEPAG